MRINTDKVRTDGYYYQIEDAFKKCPNALLYLIVGGRNTGKTYSTLKYLIEHNITFAYIKRTNDDIKAISVKTVTRNKAVKVMDVDLSPFKSINRDCGTNVKAIAVDKGISGFYNCDADGLPCSKLLGYALSLNAVQFFKGFDLSDVDVICFDEASQLLGTNAYKEDIAILELYKTITRDSVHKGRNVPLIALSNACDINAPIVKAFNLVQDLTNLIVSKKEDLIVDRDGAKIYLQMLKPNPHFLQKERESPLYKLTKGTLWNEYAYGNDFSYCDTSKCITVDEFKQRVLDTMPVYDMSYICRIKYNRQQYSLLQVSNLGGSDNDNDDEIGALYYLYADTKVRDIKNKFDFSTESDRRQFSELLGVTVNKLITAGVFYFENYDLYTLIYHDDYLRKGVM